MKKVVFLTFMSFVFVFLACSNKIEGVKEFGGTVFYIYSGSDEGTVKLKNDGKVILKKSEDAEEVVFSFFDSKKKPVQFAGISEDGREEEKGLNLKGLPYFDNVAYYKVEYPDDSYVQDYIFVTAIDKNAEARAEGDNIIKGENGRMCWSAYYSSDSSERTYTVYDENSKNEEYCGNPDHPAAEYVPDAVNYTSRNIGQGRANTELLLGISKYLENRTEGLPAGEPAKTVWQLVKEKRESNEELENWFVPSRFEQDELLKFFGGDAANGGNFYKILKPENGGYVKCWSSSAFANGSSAYNWISSGGTDLQYPTAYLNTATQRDEAPKNRSCFVLITAY